MAFNQMGGRREGAGRPRGVPNRITTDLKAMILGALDDAGGQRYLARQAIENPGPFMALLGKILPTQVASTDGSPAALHLLAARAVSAEIIAAMDWREQRTIAGRVAPANDPANGKIVNILDAPAPLE